MTKRTIFRAAAGLALILTTALGAGTAHAQTTGTARAQIAPRRLALPLPAFPQGSRLTDTHVDRTAQAVDGDTVLAAEAGDSRQGTLYAHLHSAGSLYHYALVRRDGSIAYLAQSFPTTGAAQAAWVGDTTFLNTWYDPCRKPNLVAVRGHYSTCAWSSSRSAHLLGVGVIGNVEFAFDVYSEKANDAGFGQVIADASTLVRHAFAAYGRLPVTRGPAPLVHVPQAPAPVPPTATPVPAPTDTPVPPQSVPVVTYDGVSVRQTRLVIDSDGEFSPPAGDQYVTARIVITNNSDQDQMYNTLDFRLEDDAHVRYDSTFMDTNIQGHELGSGTLAPGQTVAGDVAFAVPASETRFALLWTPDFLSPGQYVPLF